MRLSEFHRAVRDEFGEVNGVILTRDLWLSDFSATADDALDRGVSPAAVWEALCNEMRVPHARRYGRGLLEPRD